MMQVGFTVLAREDDVDFNFHGRRPGDGSALVTFAADHGGCAALMGRLYYRDELLSRLRRDGAQGEYCSNAALALAVWRRWGDAGVERLEGDFCLLIWDTASNLLIAARDPLGGYPLFWVRHADRFAVGTAMGPLLELLPQRRLNLDFLAEYLARPALAIQERASPECVWEAIQRVAAGCVVQMHIATGAVKCLRAWNWLERMVDPGSAQIEEIAGQFAQRFRPAVRERIQGLTASRLSGGMDSTAVSLTARDCLRASGQTPLHTLSIVYPRLETLAGEIPYIEAALADQPDIVSHKIVGDELLTYDSFEDPPDHDEPFPGLFDMARERVLIDTAAQAGVQTILTGHGGDDMLEVPPFHITELLRTGRLWAAWRDASRWAAARNVDPWVLFYRFGVANLLPMRLRGGMRALVNRGLVDWKHQGEGSIAPWIRPRFARTHHLYERGLRNLRWLYASCRPVSLSLALASIQAHVGDCCRWSLAAPRGIAIAHPFTDPRLLCLGLGIAVRFRQEPGTHKPLLASALGDVLPEKIRKRRAKGHFNEVYYRGLARRLPTLEKLINQPAIDELGLFDGQMLMQCLRQTALGIEHSTAGSMRLDLTLSAIAWLSTAERWRASMVPPVETVRITRDTLRAAAGWRPAAPMPSIAP
jgi:asparagine synthase (glutamine-hydrolysing)